MANAEDFVVKMVDGVSAPAAAATSASASLEAQIAAGADALREMQAQMKLLDQATTKDAGAMTALEAKIGAQKDVLQELQQAYVDTGGSAQEALDIAKGGAEALAQAEAEATAAAQEAASAQEDLAASASESAESMAGAGDSAEGASVNARGLAVAFRSLGGGAGGALAKVSQLGRAFTQLGPEVGLAVAALAVFAAGIFAIGAAIAKGIESAGQYRDELLRLEGATKGNVGAAKELQNAITAVSAGSALGRGQIEGYASSLAATGLKGAELQRALEAMAIAGSAGGEQVASAFLKQVQAAKAAGGSVDALSAKMKKQLGGVAAEQALSLGAQLSKLKENITGIFSGADIEPLLKALHSVLSIFDQTSASGKSLKATVTAAMNAVIGVILKVVSTALHMYLAIRQNQTAWAALKVIAGGIVVAFGLIAAAIVVVIGAVGAVLAAIAAPFVALGVAISAAYSGIVAAWEAIKGAFNSAKASLSNFSLSDVASNLVQSLASGILGGIGSVVQAMMSLGGAAKSALKAALGIASPSKPALEAAANVTGTFADKVEDGTEDTRAAFKKMIDPPKNAGGKVSVGDGAAGKAVQFINCVFGNVSKETLEEWMLEILDRDARGVVAPANG